MKPRKSNYVKIVASIQPGAEGVRLLCTVCLDKAGADRQSEPADTQHVLLKSDVLWNGEEIASGICDNCETMYMCRVIG